MDSLRRLLVSFRSQDYARLEAIVVTACSPSLKEAALEEFAADKRIKVISLETPLGANESRNIGIMHATGDVIAFVDDDAVLSRGWAGVLGD